MVNLGLLDPRYCLTDEAGSVAALGLAYHHIPVDFNAPQAEDLLRFFAVMDGAQDQKVFVHCAANYRVSSFVALYGEARLAGRPRRVTRTSGGSGGRTRRGRASSPRRAAVWPAP